MKAILTFQVDGLAQENEFDLSELNLTGSEPDEEIRNIVVSAFSEKSGVSLSPDAYLVKRDGEVIQIVPSFEFGSGEFVRIYNGTAHDVKILSKKGVIYDSSIRKYLLSDPGALAEVVAVFPKQKMLSVEFDVEETELNDIPVQRKKLKHIDPLPLGYDYYIVSAQYASFHAEPSRLLVVSDPVYQSKDDIRPVGVLALAFFK